LGAAQDWYRERKTSVRDQIENEGSCAEWCHRGDGGAQWFLRVITPPPTFGHSSPQEREDAFHANMNALEKGAQVLNKKFTGKPRGVQT